MEGVMKLNTSGWKQCWETWDLRLALLFSLFLQIFLTFSAPLRKRKSKGCVLVLMWFAYLLADATAIFAAGLIVKGQGETYGPFANPALVAFWAPFLVVHLGGPHTITAFALEDNELWLRHLFGLGFPCWAVVYAFFQSFPKGELWVCTSLIFTTGLIKYFERTRSLYLASSGTFKDSFLLKPDPGPEYAKLMDEYTSYIEAGLPTKIEMIPDPCMRVNKTQYKEHPAELPNLMVLQRAYGSFETLKALVAGMILNFCAHGQSRDFFLNRTPADAFKVMEVELNFLYDILYTKAMVVQGMLGYIFRILLFILNFSSLALFYFTEKMEFEKFDIGVTYTLLLGAIALDLISFVMVLYSDWTVVALTKSNNPNRGIMILQNLLHVNGESWPKIPQKLSRCFSLGKIMQIVHLRWSKSVSQFNLLRYSLHPRMKWWETTVGIFGLTNMLDGIKYVESVEFTDNLRDFIFKELKEKSEIADDLETAKKMSSARGDWILWYQGHIDLFRWIMDIEFDESLLMWHLATELCFNTDGEEWYPTSTNPDEECVIKKFLLVSKLLSDYMLYLLIVDSSMISTVVGNGKMRFRDTCAEAKQLFQKRKELGTVRQQSQTSCCKEGKASYRLQIKEACSSILGVNTAVEPAAVKGGRSKSVLFDACMLAKELMKMERSSMWETISKVWVELLSYAACHSRTNTHAAQVGKGGQLMTFVWLLMAHLGLGNQFETTGGNAMAKLIVRS